LPYPLILQKSARDALGISLKNHVVVIDEAHNLMDAICGIYSCSISLSQLNLAREQLMIYLKKFAARLKGKNRVYVTQTVRLIDSLIAYLQSKDAKDGICKPAELLAGRGVDQINLFKLNAYIQESRLARKVDGYNSQIQEAEKKTEKTTAPVLMQVQSFMLALMNPSAEGRFFYAKDDSGLHLKYMLLDPTKCFQEVVEEARAVILAGGTMSPMEDYRQHLFSYIPESRIQTLTCSHIVPPSSLVVYPVSKDRRGTDFTFTFEKRSQRDTIVAAGQALLEFISIIPDGAVAFFPSYGYLAACMAVWQATTTPTSSNLWKSMQAAKPVFWEQHKAGSNDAAAGRPAATSETESALAAYTAAVRSPPKPHRGALLLAVISGSLSEGINFSDELGRGVLVFGLPYPNPRSAEWTARGGEGGGGGEGRGGGEGVLRERDDAGGGAGGGEGDQA
jgi:chromosome transmission fidelity protein 1